jgi:hypothetical protein
MTLPWVRQEPRCVVIQVPGARFQNIAKEEEYDARGAQLFSSRGILQALYQAEGQTRYSV